MTGTDNRLQAFGELVRAQRRLARVSQRNLARMSSPNSINASFLRVGKG
jgi:hypothetical protein